MTYQEAKELLEKHRNYMPTDVLLFIGKEGLQSELRLKTEDDDNRLALEKSGLINSDDLDVFVTYQEGDKIRYPTLSYYLTIQTFLKGQ